MSQVRATTSFRLPGRRIVKTGEIFAADDPIVAGREALFAAIIDPNATTDVAPAKEITRSEEPKKAPAKKAAAKSDD